MAEPVSALLRRSFGHLADEVPDSYRLLLDELGSLVVHLDVDGEQFSLSGGRSLDVTEGAPRDADVRIGTSRAAIADLLDARSTLERAVDDGTVRVIGALDHIVQAHDTLLAYVHAAVRAPSHPDLMGNLRPGQR